MKVVLEHQESENLFFDALCNGASELAYYDLELDYNYNEYQEAKWILEAQTPDETICYEDVMMQMLRSGNTIWVVDSNDDERHPITLQLVHDRVANTPIRHLMDAINEHGDATTADCILQTVIYNEVIYG
jgi:hypothetical protein